MMIKMGGATPMEFLGEFLQLVCGSKELELKLLNQRSSRVRAPSTATQSFHTSITSPTASGIAMHGV